MTVTVSVPALPAASRAVTVITLEPLTRVMPEADQLVVPVAVPLPPWLLVHVTWVTPMLSEAVPPRVSGLELVLYVGFEVGEVIVTVGGVVSAVAAVVKV